MIKTVTGNIRYIRNAFHESRGYTCLIVLLNIFAGCMPALKVLAIGMLIDNVMLHDELGRETLLWDACTIILVYLLEYSFTAVQSYLQYRCRIRLNNSMEDTFYTRLSQIKYAVLENKAHNDLIYHVKDGIAKKFADGFSKILEFASFLIRTGSIFLVVMTKNLWIGILLLVVFVSLAPLYRKIGEDNYEAYTEANKEFRRAGSYQAMLTNREYANEREVFSYADFFLAKWRDRYHSANEKELKASRQNHLKILLITAAVTVLTTLLSGIMIPMLLNGSLSLGVYVVIVTQLYDLVHFMSWNFSYIIDDLSENQLYLNDFDSFMKLETISETVQRETVSANHLTIRVEGLSFRYPGCEEYVLKDFSFTFKAGKHYAIVGKNGAGKTTLVKLLLGLYDEYEGHIYINDTDIRTLPQDEIRKVFSAVFQDYARYALTIKENILLKNSDDPAKAEQAEAVLEQLGVLEDIQQLSSGIDTGLGKIDGNGIDLSGGQWQKLAIARGAVTDAHMYILDEPTSALDPISERHLYEMYNHIFKDKTTILITHRLGNTKDQDEILVLDAGRLVEHGHHRALMEQQSVYYDMFVKQRSWYHEDAL